MKGSLIIVSFFIVGTFCGLYHLIPYEFTHSNLSYYALCGLMFCVGISIGNDPNTLKSFRSLNPRLLFLPVMTILGTLAGCAVASLFLPHRSATDCMAVGAGFGWYSLAPGIIMDAGLIEASAVSFLHNVLREIISILFLPFVAGKIGYIEAACMGGAPAMDVCLPVINKETKGKAVTYGFITGVIMSFLVPFSVPLALSIF